LFRRNYLALKELYDSLRQEIKLLQMHNPALAVERSKGRQMSTRNMRVLLAVTIGLAIPTFVSAADRPEKVAAKVDRLLRGEVPFANAAKVPPPRIDDERFLRRVSLDIIGRLPTPEEVTAFALDPSADKRSTIVDRLLADSRYGENWGRYWRDVIMYRKTEERQQFLVGIPLESYLAESLNQNKPWSQIATEFITAKGGANENGACGLIVAQQGQPEEIVGEVSRIFLGVQIQCAQCHDHPTDRWKREQFHQLAAFFPRVASQPSRQGQNRQMLPEITVTATDSEVRLGFRGPMNMRVRGTPEHRMSDPKNPQSEGTLMQPVLFATGDKLPIGTPDAERRGSLAKWITEKDNPYFAKAFVNRIWSELTGEGFYEPIDDMGPDRHATAPKTLESLARDFADTGYDVKWLFRVITATQMYQLPSAPRRGPEDPPMQHNVAQRLRSDEVFDNLLIVLEASEPSPPGGAMGPAARFAGGPRRQFTTAFGYDPSTRRDEIQSSIPQALTLMNMPMIAAGLRGTGNTMLARKLAAIKDDPALVQELYLRVLGREASQSELTTCLQFVKQVNNRTEAFEDVLWGLVNSAEFLHRS
jgi:uncharacterized protein DUF1549/uncharacterized protein DUF1553